VGAPSDAADFFTIDLDDPSIAGAGEDSLLSAIVFSGGRAAIRDVIVGGHRIVEEGRHRLQGEIVKQFAAVQRKLWGARP
jgi:formimidoylglutamate deiminase